MKYSHILFDLDGTLIDSKETIRRSFEYALNKMQVPNSKITDVNALIGPPMLTTLQEVFGFTLSEAQKGYQYYLEEYVDNGQMFQAKLYDGVRDTVHKLSQLGCFLAVATTKNEIYARKIVKKQGLDIEMHRVYGAHNDGTRSDKKRIITDLLEDYNITDRSEVLMVGDRHFDINGAQAVGIDSVGVLYGCGSAKELQDAGPTYLISSINELLTII